MPRATILYPLFFLLLSKCPRRYVYMILCFHPDGSIGHAFAQCNVRHPSSLFAYLLFLLHRFAWRGCQIWWMTTRETFVPLMDRLFPLPKEPRLFLGLVPGSTPPKVCRQPIATSPVTCRYVRIQGPPAARTPPLGVSVKARLFALPPLPFCFCVIVFSFAPPCFRPRSFLSHHTYCSCQNALSRRLPVGAPWFFFTY